MDLILSDQETLKQQKESYKIRCVDIIHKDIHLSRMTFAVLMHEIYRYHRKAIHRSLVNGQ
jgi:hypothetical protein